MGATLGPIRFSHGAGQDRHSRLGFLGAGHGDPPQAGRDRGLRGARARRRRGGDLAGEHLPGLPVRRALAPLLVLVRAQPEVEPDVLHAAGDLGLPARLHRPLRHPRVHPLRPRGDPSGVGRGCPALADRDERERADGAHPDIGGGAADGAPAPGDTGAGALRGSGVPLREVGPRPRPARRARRVDRHRSVGDPVRAQDPAAGGTPARVPAHGSVGRAAHGPPDHPARAPAVPGPPAPPAAGALRDLPGPGVAGAGTGAGSEAVEAPGGRRAPALAPPGPRSRAAPAADARLLRGGCSSWYIDRTGRITTLWPGFTWGFRRRTARFDPDDYLLETGVPRPEPATV
jgi:hypothetical protein